MRPIPSLSGKLPAFHSLRYDVEHSEAEESWITLGQAETGQLLVVVHTFEELSDEETRVRIISARSATTHERRQYESG